MSKFTQNPYSQLEERVGSRSLYVEMREKKAVICLIFIIILLLNCFI